MNTNKLENILSNAKLDYSSLMLLNIYNTHELANFLKDKLSDKEVSEMAKASDLSIKAYRHLDYDMDYEFYVYFMEISKGEELITNIMKKEVFPIHNEYYHDYDNYWEI
jgi:hypothetical protein